MKLSLLNKTLLTGLLFNITSFCFGKDRISEMPNLIILLADDLGYGDLSCYNEESKIQTPVLDALAKEGVTFSNMHSTSAVCTPSRYSVLTGQYNWRSP